jgi:hypothetical protein
MKTIVAVYLFIVLLVAVGWVKNIVKLTQCDFETPYKAEVIHAVGVLPPVGAITGWLDLGE